MKERVGGEREQGGERGGKGEEEERMREGGVERGGGESEGREKEEERVGEREGERFRIYTYFQGQGRF